MPPSTPPSAFPRRFPMPPNRRFASAVKFCKDSKSRTSVPRSGAYARPTHLWERRGFRRRERVARIFITAASDGKPRPAHRQSRILPRRDLMHEFSIARNILDIAAEEAEPRRAVARRAVHLQPGPLAGVAKDALRSAYDLAREGSSLADSRLVVEEVPVVVYCPACRSEQRVTSFPELCCSCCGAAA